MSDNLTEDQMKEIRELIEEYNKKDDDEKVERVVSKVIEEFKRRYSHKES